MGEKKVLVGCPVYSGTEYSIARFLNTIKSLDYDNYDILLVDNSKENDFFNKLKNEEGITLIKDNTTKEKNMLRLISSRNKILEFALNKDYDYLLMMDSDVIPPKNIINKLLLKNKDIISGLYFNYLRISGKLKWLPIAWKTLTSKEFKELKRLNIKLSFDAKSHEDIRRHLTEEECGSNQVHEVFICSPGCMLISKNILQNPNIKYGILEKNELLGKSTTDDIYFLKKAREEGYKIYCDVSLKCNHLVDEKFKKWDVHPMHQ